MTQNFMIEVLGRIILMSTLVQDGSDGLTRMKAKLLKRYLAKSDHKHRFQDFTDASRDKNGKFSSVWFYCISI
jgi:hypothetical protein